VAELLLDAALATAAERGLSTVTVTAREELPDTIGFWVKHGFRELERVPPYVELRRPVHGGVFEVPDADSMHRLGGRVARWLRPGDLVVLTGSLGAGKTTFTQGLGDGLGVRGPVTSPTFVIARVHPSEVGGPALVHADAYRLGGAAELDDLDLDASLADSVTLVEWGEGLAEGLAEDRLEVAITRSTGGDAAPEGDEVRTVRLTPVGARWVGSDVADLVG
jgi:tRNA threonylcarbamoyladenosine biosynthesis protein TsaE